MRQSIQPALIAAITLLALPAPVSAAPGSVNDFRLPQGGSTATPAPARQGPVVPDVPESQATPTPTPTPTPAPRATASPGPTTTPRPAITLPAPTRSAVPGPVPTPRATVPAAVPVATPTLAPKPMAPATAANPAPAPLPQPLPAPPLAPVADSGSPGWLAWALGAAALLALLAVGWLVARKRIGVVRQEEAPLVERPRPAATPVTPPAPAAAEPPAAARDPLQVTMVPVRMSLTLVNAVLNWEVELANHGTAPLNGLTLAADMISAHADLSPEDRSSGPAAGADSQSLGQLAPGDQLRTAGEIRLPFPHIVPIWHGEIALLMPLLRLRIAADGIMPVTRIFLVGQPSPTDAATLQPFRLDLGPRVYPDLAQRAFA